MEKHTDSLAGASRAATSPPDDTDKAAEAGEKRFLGRTRRVAAVSGGVANLALGAFARRYLGADDNLDQAAKKATDVIGGLKGPFMKIFQILATIPDVLPKEYSEALRQLQSNAPPMGWPFVQRRMRSELGKDWSDKLPGFSRQAVHAASLGQVHRARLPTGEDVACKLQYPDMTSVIDADLKQLNLVLGLYQRAGSPAISPKNIYQELVARLHEELDYRRESKNMQLYSEMLSGESAVHIPHPVGGLCTRRLLVMDWLSGTSLMDLTDKPAEQRNQLARAMFRAWYVPLYRYGIIHGDPHPGNYSARDDLGINLLDFGCIRVFPARFVLGVIELYRAFYHQDDDRAAHAYSLWGFQNVDRELLEILNVWAKFLYTPLLEDKVQKIQPSDSGRYGANVMSGVYRKLRERGGGIAPPGEFLLMDRAAIGLGAIFMRLRAEINWHREFHDLIADFDADRLAVDQQAILTRHDLLDVLPSKTSA